MGYETTTSQQAPGVDVARKEAQKQPMKNNYTRSVSIDFVVKHKFSKEFSSGSSRREQ